CSSDLVAGYAIVLADRQRKLPVVVAAHDSVEAEQILDGALAERLLTDHDAAAVVLNGRCKDLGSARAVAVDEHDERPVVHELVRARIIEHLHAAARLLELHDR